MKNGILKYWPILTFTIPLLLGGITGYATLQAKVISADTLSKDTAKVVAENEKRLIVQEAGQQYIKESLERQEQKIDKLIELQQKRGR